MNATSLRSPSLPQWASPPYADVGTALADARHMLATNNPRGAMRALTAVMVILAQEQGKAEVGALAADLMAQLTQRLN